MSDLHTIRALSFGFHGGKAVLATDEPTYHQAWRKWMKERPKKSSATEPAAELIRSEKVA
jgi:hypothetical protein